MLTEVRVTTTVAAGDGRQVEVDYECPQPLSGARGVSDVQGYSVCAAES